MGYRLRDGVSFCCVLDRFIFLDIMEDRYFGLPASSEQAFANLVATGWMSAADSEALSPLCRSGVLQKEPDPTRLSPCPGICEPRNSLLDDERAAAPADVLVATVQRVVAAWHLRQRSLASLLGDIAASKAGVSRQAEPLTTAAGVAAAFRQAALLVSAQDRCLATSIAVMRRLLVLAVPADLVLGVKLRPFQAHCWVQLGEVVVNDRVDTVRPFTPILVV